MQHQIIRLRIISKFSPSMPHEFRYIHFTQTTAIEFRMLFNGNTRVTQIEHLQLNARKSYLQIPSICNFCLPDSENIKSHFHLADRRKIFFFVQFCLVRHQFIT